MQLIFKDGMEESRGLQSHGLEKFEADGTVHNWVGIK